MRNHCWGKSLLFLFVVVAVCFSLASITAAAPAVSVPRDYEQPSGETFTATQFGDEWFNWVETEDGDVILLGEDGYWHYAKVSGSGLKILDEKVAIDKTPRNAASSEKVRKQSKEWKNKKIESFTKTSSKNRGEMMETHKTPEKLLVLLVEFSNISMRYPESSWPGVFFNDSPGSLNHYYKENSSGNFYFKPAEEQGGTTNDGFIRVRLPYPHPNTGGDLGVKNEMIVRDALQAADQYIDFKTFDTDKNGFISAKELHVMTIVAGYEAAYDPSNTPNTWGHKGSLSKPVTLDSVTLGNGDYDGGYTQFGEVQGDKMYQDDHMATIGIIAHELGHDLGLPDLYDGDGSSSGLGIHSLMASGSWAYLTGYSGSMPTHFDPWSKMMLGFVEPAIATSSGEYTLFSIGTNNYNMIKVPTSDPDQYFLVENRQFEGYDSSLQDYVSTGGVAIWHIDENVLRKTWYYNKVNNDEKHKGVDLEEANESILGYSQLDKRVYGVLYDHYFNSRFPIFSPATRPSSDLYNNTKTNIAISTTNTSASRMQVKLDLPNLMEGLELSQNTLTLQVGETQTVQAFATYSDKTKEDVTSQATWSKNSNLIDLNKGTITAKKPGNVTVSVSYMGKTVTLPVTVKAQIKTVSKIELDKKSATLKGNETVSLQVTATYSDKTTENVTEQVTWTVKNSKIASVDKGVVTALAPGTTTITATLGTKKAIFTLKVADSKKLVKLQADQTRVSLKIEEQKQILVTATYEDGSTADVTDTITWTTSNSQVASVENGLIVAKAKGTTTITGKSGTKFVRVQVTVTNG
ncbi:M6 family metalloprotease domain-containing protein [Brevibacillus sp. SYSU BS000544]|uniref:M6 family metalloprotease domain-containing protein n=1 Tax=Brevibacillus sp. SYSU BS000544 TaxID=3416443 RepID=UPI003CE4ADA1